MRERVLVALLLCFASVATVLAGELPTYRLGVIVPLSGDLAYVGEDIRRGMELAVQRAKHLRVELLFEDSQHQSKQAVTAAKLLVKQKRVHALVSLWDTTEAVAPIAERAQIPNIAIRWNHHVAEKYQYTFTIEATYQTYTRSQLRLLRHLEAGSVVLVGVQSSGWGLAEDFFESHSRYFGVKVKDRIDFAPGTSDFNSIVTKVLAAKADYVVLSTDPPTTALLVSKIKAMSGGAQKVTGYFEGDPAVQAFEGLPYVSLTNPAPWFSQLYLRRYGKPYENRAPHGYDIVAIIDHLHGGEKKVLPSIEFERRFRMIEKFDGASGSLTAKDTRTLETEPLWVVLRQGHLQPLLQEQQTQ